MEEAAQSMQRDCILKCIICILGRMRTTLVFPNTVNVSAIDVLQN